MVLLGVNLVSTSKINLSIPYKHTALTLKMVNFLPSNKCNYSLLEEKSLLCRVTAEILCSIAKGQSSLCPEISRLGAPG